MFSPKNVDVYSSPVLRTQAAAPAVIGHKLPRPTVGRKLAAAAAVWAGASPLQSSWACALGKRSANVLSRLRAGKPRGDWAQRVRLEPPGKRTASDPNLGRQDLLYPCVLTTGSSGAPGWQSWRGRGVSPAPLGPEDQDRLGALPAARGQENRWV